MVVRVTPHLSYGPMCACRAVRCAAYIHACKHPCWEGKGVLRPGQHVHEEGDHLYLNMIDPDQPLFVPELFTASLDFIDCHVADRRVVVHCNQGLSRSPSIVLLWMAKRGNLLPNGSFETAAAAFRSKYPYRPNRGIVAFLNSIWGEIK